MPFLLALQQNPIVVEVAKQPPPTKDASIDAVLSIFALAGVFLLAAAFIVTGRVTVQLDQQAHSAYVVDRFTGEVRICNANGCRDLPGFGGPSVALPSPHDIARSIRKPKQ